MFWILSLLFRAHELSFINTILDKDLSDEIYLAVHL